MLFILSKIPGWNCFELFSTPYPLLPSHPVFSSLAALEHICAPKYRVPSSCTLCLRYDHHDALVEMIPNVVSWTHKLPQNKHILFLKSCRIRHFSLPFPMSLLDFSFLSCKASAPLKELPPSIIDFWLLVCPLLLFSF